MKIIYTIVIGIACFLLGANALAQNTFRADVLDIETQVSSNQDLIVTVFNSSKMPATLSSITAELSPGCSFSTSVPDVKPGSVQKLMLASRKQIRACNISSLNSLISAKQMITLFKPVSADQGELTFPSTTIPRPVISKKRVRNLPKEFPFTIKFEGSTQEKEFTTTGSWVLKLAPNNR